MQKTKASTRVSETRQHAKLSASGSSRWLACPGSYNAESRYPKDKGSVYAAEGSLAHSFAEACLTQGVDADLCKFDNDAVDTDMKRYVQQYLDYVRSYETANSVLFIEERVDFSNIVSEGFGTLDAAVLDYDTGVCHIFDLKYGKGISVDAFENSQAQLYALGMHNELAFLEVCSHFELHIVQPRTSNFSQWGLSAEDLTKFGKHVALRSELCLTKTAPRVPGEVQCRWCRAKADCTALGSFVEQIITADFDNLDEINDAKRNSLSDRAKRMILDHKKLITEFLSAIENSVKLRLLDGKTFDGYKLVEGRSIRKWIEATAELSLVEKLGDKAYNRALIGVTAAQKLVGKDLVDELTNKPPGKLTLAPESDKRKAVVATAAINDFDVLNDPGK